MPLLQRLALEVRDQRGGIVGDDGVHTRGDQAVPILGAVGGPGNHGQAGGVSSGCSGKIFVSMLKPNFPLAASAKTSSRAGMRVPGTVCCFGNAGFFVAPQSHCLTSASVSCRMTARGAGPVQIGGAK